MTSITEKKNEKSAILYFIYIIIAVVVRSIYWVRILFSRFWPEFRFWPQSRFWPEKLILLCTTFLEKDPKNLSTQNKTKKRLKTPSLPTAHYLYTIPWSNIITVFCIHNQNLHFQRKSWFLSFRMLVSCSSVESIVNRTVDSTAKNWRTRESFKKRDFQQSF